MPPIMRRSRLPSRHDARAWAALPAPERTTRENARDGLARSGRRHAAAYQTLLAASHRLGGPATATDTTGGEDEEVRP